MWKVRVSKETLNVSIILFATLFADTVLNTVSRDLALHGFLSVLSPRHAIAYHYISTRVRGRHRGMDALRVEKWNSNRSLAVDFISPCFAFPVVRDNNVVSVRIDRSIDPTTFEKPVPSSLSPPLLPFSPYIYIYIFRFFESIGQSGKGWSENRGSLFFYKRNVKKRISKSLFILIAENCRFEWHVEKTGGKLRAGIRIATFH